MDLTDHGLGTSGQKDRVAHRRVLGSGSATQLITLV